MYALLPYNLQIEAT